MIMAHKIKNPLKYHEKRIKKLDKKLNKIFRELFKFKLKRR